MTVMNLVETCANSGVGKIKILMESGENAVVSIDELEKFPHFCNQIVKNWEFIPKRQISAIGWEFILEITI